MIDKLLSVMHGMNNIRLKNKLMISFILVVFVPVMIVGVFLTAEFRQNVLDRATEQTLNNVDRIKKRATDTLRMPIEISNNMLVDDRLKRVVNTHYETTFDIVKAFWDYRSFKDYVQLYKEVHNIRFYTTNTTIVSNWDFLTPDESVTKSFWYQTVMRKNTESISWFYIHDETKENGKFLSLVRRISFPEYRTSGVLVIDIDQDELNAIVSQEPFDTMILDDKGNIIAAKNTQWVGHTITELDFAKELTDKATGTYEFKVDGKPSKVIVENLVPPYSQNGLKIVSVFTIESIVSGANRISRLGFTIIIISLVIAFVLIYFTSSFLSRRMLLLNKYISRVALGDLKVISTVDGNDEIGLLSRQFNNMVSSIRTLMDEISESHKQKTQLQLRQREIKLKMMASQINPHFLFNALESIRMKAHVKGEAEIATIVRLLGKMMRRNIEIGARNISLKEELDVVRCYLEIQKFRYGDDRLMFELDSDIDGGYVEIPPLIVQPLVENAVVHGLENREEGGLVKVSAKVVEGGLLIEVWDNGSGIPEERRHEIERALHDMDESEEYRIGLRNVHQRLVLTYGDSCGLSITSDPGIGTRVSFLLPIGGERDVQGTAG